MSKQTEKVLREVFDLVDGAWDSIVISDSLFDRMLYVLEESSKENLTVAPSIKKEQLSESFLKSTEGIDKALNKKKVKD